VASSGSTLPRPDSCRRSRGLHAGNADPADSPQAMQIAASRSAPCPIRSPCCAPTSPRANPDAGARIAGTANRPIPTACPSP
jgi:hypothetical protein